MKVGFSSAVRWLYFILFFSDARLEAKKKTAETSYNRLPDYLGRDSLGMSRDNEQKQAKFSTSFTGAEGNWNSLDSDGVEKTGFGAYAISTGSERGEEKSFNNTHRRVRGGTA